jgi:hypothetical protein
MWHAALSRSGFAPLPIGSVARRCSVALQLLDVLFRRPDGFDPATHAAYVVISVPSIDLYEPWVLHERAPYGVPIRLIFLSIGESYSPAYPMFVEHARARA